MAVSFPDSPHEGKIYQNPATGAYYKYTDDSWSVLCFENQVDCEPTKTLPNAGEHTYPLPDKISWEIRTDGDTSLLFREEDAYLPDDFDGDPPDRLFINGTGFVVQNWFAVNGTNLFYGRINLVGDQRTFFEDPANSTLALGFCDGDAYVTLNYFNADQKRQDDRIIELEEEFANLLPSLDRGAWRYNEDYTKPPGKFGLRTDAGGLPTAFNQVAKIIIHGTDDAGEDHGFGDIKVDSYIQIFQDGDFDTAIYHVDALPVQNGDEFEFEVSFVREEGEYPELDELFRFKFYEIVGGDAGAYVLKTGDTMSGQLTFAAPPITAPDDPDLQCGNISLNPTTNNPSININGEESIFIESKYSNFTTVKSDIASLYTQTEQKRDYYSWVLREVASGTFRGSMSMSSGGITLSSKQGGIQVTGSTNDSKNTFKTENDTIFKWGDSGIDFNDNNLSNINTIYYGSDAQIQFTDNGMYFYDDVDWMSSDGTSGFFHTRADGPKLEDCHVRYYGAIVNDEDIVNKKYVDENSGGVEVIAGTPDAPIPLGKMWFDTTKNALYLKTSN